MKIHFQFPVCLFGFLAAFALSFSAVQGDHFLLDDMVFVEGGAFKLNGKQMQVKSFHIDKYEVTLGDFQRFVSATGYKTQVEKIGKSQIVRNYKWVFENGINWRHDILGKVIPEDQYSLIPVSNVTITDAQAFAKWAGKRIPTPVEWEFAARGGKKSKGYKYSGSNQVKKVAWIDENAFEIIQKVGTKLPNELGIYDMSGNVHEFVMDAQKYHARGGCYFSHAEWAEVKDEGWKVRTDEAFPTFGFRCVKESK